jgi:hypothetical protein
MKNNIETIVKNSPSILESQILSDDQMSTLEGGCVFACDPTCVTCTTSCLLSRQSKGTSTTPS